MFAGALLILQVFLPPAEAEGKDKEATDASGKKAAAHSGTTTQKAKTTTTTAKTSKTATSATSKDMTGSMDDLTFLSSIMDLLKDGKSLPPEYLAMLPDGGQGILATQSSTDTSSISKPLQSQLASINRSTGTTYRPSNSSYVPSQSGGVTEAYPGRRDVPSQQQQPTQQDQPTYTPQPEPTPSIPNQNPNIPVTPMPPPATSAVLLDNGLLKSILGKSKGDVQDFLQYNQFLGQEGNLLRYLIGSTMVEITMNGDTATQVVLRFDRFTPQGKDVNYYAEYMRSIAGMSRANPNRQTEKDIYFSGVYPGASNIIFHIDINSNFGYVQATR